MANKNQANTHVYPLAHSAKDERVSKAVSVWSNSPNLTVQQVMLAAQFCHDDAYNRAKQAWIRRRAPTKKSLKKPTIISLFDDGTDKSSLTASPVPKLARSGPANPLPISKSQGNRWQSLYQW